MKNNLKLMVVLSAAALLASCGTPASSTSSAASASGTAASSQVTPSSETSVSEASSEVSSSSGIVADPLDTKTKVADFLGDSSDFFASSGYGNGGHFNVEWSSSEAQIKDDGLHLSIHANREGAEYPWKGGEYRSKGFYGYGDFGTRMKVSPTSGTASTFFTYTGEWDSDEIHPSTGESDTKNPDNPEGIHDEIDIEFLGKDTTKVQFNYFTNGVGGHEYMYDLGFDASKDFHDYGFRWEEDKITWFVDGKPVYQAFENIPSHPGRIITNYWCAAPSAAGWMGEFDSTVDNDCVYQWHSSNADVQETHKEPEVPQPGEDFDWDKIDPIDLKVNDGADDVYTLDVSEDKKSLDVSYSAVPAQSYKNFSLDIPEALRTTNRLAFEVENLGETDIQLRADVNGPELVGNTTAINTSAYFNGTSVYTDTEWGGSKFDIAAGAKGLVEINYVGTPINLMFMVDSAIYQDTAESHAGHLAIKNLKLASIEAEEGLTLNFSGEPYTCLNEAGKSVITYESVDDNSYKNVFASIANVPAEANYFEMTVANKGEEKVQLNIDLGTNGEGGLTSRLVNNDCYDWYNVDQNRAQYNINAGESRALAFFFDQTAGAVDAMMMFINSAWAETTSTHTNGNIEITGAAFSILD